MSDLIDRQTAIDAVHEDFDSCLVWDESGQRTADEFEIIISRLPSAQPKRGRWIVKGQDIYCSECDNESAYNPFGASKFSLYCPNCGARME